jgi:hypothetical protein
MANPQNTKMMTVKMKSKPAASKHVRWIIIDKDSKETVIRLPLLILDFFCQNLRNETDLVS